MYILNNTLFIGKVFYSFDNLPSTNTYAVNLIKRQKVVEGSVVHTIAQTNGRGQQQNAWHSEANNNITISIILFPKFLRAMQQFELSRAVALGTYHFTKQIVGDKVSLKWPNDIYISDKKIGGILIENSITGQYLGSSVIGIGLNVNQINFPENIANPSSLQLETGQVFEVIDLIEKLCHEIEKQYLRLKNEHFRAIKMEYEAVLYRFEEYAFYEIPKNGKVIFAKIIGTTAVGKLMLESKYELDKNKKPICYVFDLKEIKFVLS
ncbi:MAG: biotin--[acetyl-CoA-carboxylase] ligase [Chitinophagales bacterium]